MTKLPQSDLNHLTAEIGRLLDDIVPEIAEKIWDRWLKEYWEMRLLGIPRPLSQEEATNMVHWSLCLGQRLRESLNLIQKMHGMVEFGHHDLLYRIEKKGISKSQPHETVELILFFFKSAPKHFYPSKYIHEIWKDLKVGGIPSEVLKKIREAMLALGHDPEQES